MSKSGHEYFRLGAGSLGRVGKKEKKIACALLDVSPVDKFRVLACIGY